MLVMLVDSTALKFEDSTQIFFKKYVLKKRFTFFLYRDCQGIFQNLSSEEPKHVLCQSLNSGRPKQIYCRIQSVSDVSFFTFFYILFHNFSLNFAISHYQDVIDKVLNFFRIMAIMKWKNLKQKK
ncbi:hypothetical protein BpHYR1_003198 [Brachionus plicatilis]|uniref:Uncharacterized protein n=1 Tax=Brachionus plicatilis TaxID=10195 RepID=A0A3M7PCL1_BRAPC|nr:hypothetical protein BpHYR1_003198 [Brachionus plicatilis]